MIGAAEIGHIRVTKSGIGSYASYGLFLLGTASCLPASLKSTKAGWHLPKHTANEYNLSLKSIFLY